MSERSLTFRLSIVIHIIEKEQLPVLVSRATSYVSSSTVAIIVVWYRQIPCLWWNFAETNWKRFSLHSTKKYRIDITHFVKGKTDNNIYVMPRSERVLEKRWGVKLVLQSIDHKIVNNFELMAVFMLKLSRNDFNV